MKTAVRIDGVPDRIVTRECSHSAPESRDFVERKSSSRDIPPVRSIRRLKAFC